MSIHDLYYGGEEREILAMPRSRKKIVTPAGDCYVDQIAAPSGHWPAGPVYPDVHYRIAAENGGIKNQPYWRVFAPQDWFDGIETGAYTPYDTGLAEYLHHHPLVAGDVMRLAFVPRGYALSWAEIEVGTTDNKCISGAVATGMVADLYWVRNVSGTNTETLLKADINFGVRGTTGQLPVATSAGLCGNCSDNFIELRIKTPPASMKDWRFLLHYDTTGHDYY